MAPSGIKEVPVFSSEFINLNKKRETELRHLRRNIGLVEEKIESANERVEKLKLQLDQAYSKAPHARRYAFERERQLIIWCREIACALDKAELLTELELSYDSTPDTIVRVLEKASKSSEMFDKLRRALGGTILEIF